MLATASTERDDEPKPRLVISQIVVENFKSYAGRQTIGPFHKVWARLYCALIAALVVHIDCGAQWIGQIQRH